MVKFLAFLLLYNSFLCEREGGGGESGNGGHNNYLEHLLLPIGQQVHYNHRPRLHITYIVIPSLSFSLHTHTHE